MKSKDSQRFKPSPFTEKFVPVMLAVIVLGLLVILVVTGLALLGFTPGR